MNRTRVALAAAAMMAGPAFAQQSTDDLMNRLRSTTPSDLATQANEALKQYNGLAPTDRAAADAAAQAQIPALMTQASGWWNSLTPEQQAEYQKSIQGLSGAMAPKK